MDEINLYLTMTSDNINELKFVKHDCFHFLVKRKKKSPIQKQRNDLQRNVTSHEYPYPYPYPYPFVLGMTFGLGMAFGLGLGTAFKIEKTK